MGQTSCNLKSKYQEHIQYIKNNDPRSSYALHILNCRHEYGNINDSMTLLKRINKPVLLLPYEQMYIQSFYHNNELIPEQHLNKHNPMFEFLQRKHLTSQPTCHLGTNPAHLTSSFLNGAQDSHPQR